jgi:Putative redox-active protein (C_GCAxxG_C_C)
MENLQETHNQPQNFTVAPNWKYRMTGFANLLRMGHCAPTVMKTILDITPAEKEWLVKLSAGMPGGIGNTGFECGGITSPLVLMGIHFGLRDDYGGLPVIFDKGHALCQNFIACHQTLQCREIRGNDRFPKHCIPPVLQSPELFMDAKNDNHREPIPPARRAGYSRLYSYLVDNNFHCAQAVLIHLGYAPEQNQELFDATSAFMGGTLFMGRTCSAFTAGVMAIGLRTGEIEDSPLRVIRLLAIMTVGGYAFDEKLNKFNRSMNRGYKLSKWFTEEFGSTQCQAITRCDFSDPKEVNRYIEGDCITRCKQIAEKVAVKIQIMLSTQEVSKSKREGRLS